nr:hypothetical protein [Nocardia gamkensis]
MDRVELLGCGHALVGIAEKSAAEPIGGALEPFVLTASVVDAPVREPVRPSRQSDMRIAEERRQCRQRVVEAIVAATPNA